MEALDFATAQFPGEELHRTLAGLRHQAPIRPILFLGSKAWIVTSYAALDAAFRDCQRFPPAAMYKVAIEPVFGRSFLSMDEPEHLQYRRLATPAFRSRAVERYERSGLAELADELIDGFAKDRTVDLVTAFTERFPYLVVSRMMGIPRAMEDAFHRWSTGILNYRGDGAFAKRCASELTAYLLPVLEERRRCPREDVISELIHSELDGRHLTEEEILSHIRMLFPTAGETTHGSIGNLLYALLSATDGWSKWSPNRPTSRGP